MSILIVSLPLHSAGPATEYDHVLSADGRTVQQHARASAALLPWPSGAGSEVVALVPAGALSWHPVAWPPALAKSLPRQGGSAMRLRAALAGLLEDLLLDDPEQLHFALFPGRQAEDPVWVAVCRRDWLHEALRPLETAQHVVSRIVPEFAPVLAETASTLHVTNHMEPAALTLSAPRGVLTLPCNASAVAYAAWPADATLIAEPAVAALAEQTFKRPVRLQTAAERCLQAGHSTAWNLAQFDLARSGRTRWLKALGRGWQSGLRAPQWRAARWGLGLLLLVQLLGLNALAWREKAMLAEQGAAVRQVLTQTFPELKVVVDAPLQMEREVAALQQAKGQTLGPGLDGLLLALSAVAPQGQSLNAIEFTPDKAQLQGLRLTLQEAGALAQQLQAQGWQVRVDGERLVLQAGGTP